MMSTGMSWGSAGRGTSRTWISWTVVAMGVLSVTKPYSRPKAYSMSE
jgi:hypothetical protein